MLHLTNNNNNNNNDDAMNLMDIGDDLLCNILKYLDVKSIINFENINKESCYIARIPNILEKISIKIDSILNQNTHSSLIPNSLYDNKKELYKRFSLVKKVNLYECGKNINIVFPKIIEFTYWKLLYEAKIPSKLLDIKAFHAIFLKISNDSINNIIQFSHKLYILQIKCIYTVGFVNISQNIDCNTLPSSLLSYTCSQDLSRGIASYNIIKRHAMTLKQLLLGFQPWKDISMKSMNNKIILNNLEELNLVCNSNTHTINSKSPIQYPNIKRCNLYFRTTMLSDIINSILCCEHLECLVITIHQLSTNDFISQCKRIKTTQTNKIVLSINIENSITKNALLACKNVLKHLKKSFIVKVFCKIKENWPNILEELKLLFDDITYKESQGLSWIVLSDESIFEKYTKWFVTGFSQCRIPICTYDGIKLYHTFPLE